MTYAEIWQSFIDHATRPLAPGEPIAIRVRDVIYGAAALAGRLADDLDEENREDELPLLKGQALEGLKQALAGLELPTYVAAVLQVTGPSVVTLAIDAAADKSGPVAEVRDRYIVPAIDFAIISLAGLRVRIAPDAPALSLPSRPDNAQSDQQTEPRRDASQPGPG